MSEHEKRAPRTQPIISLNPELEKYLKNQFRQNEPFVFRVKHLVIVWILFLMAFCACGLMPYAVSGFYSHMTERTIEEVEITDTYIKRVGQVDVYYVDVRYVDKNGERVSETFQNYDEPGLFVGKRDSGDVNRILSQADLDRERCTLRVSGSRNQFFSWFPNVISATCGT